MSAAVRQELADACNSVDGINVSPYFRAATRAGNGSVQFAGLSRPNRLGGVVTWQVVIFLPSGLADAERFIDERIPHVLDAISTRRVLFDALRVTPDELAIDSGTVPVVVIEGTREETS